MMRFTPSQIDDLKARNPVPAVAGQWVTLRAKGRAGKFVGPCPLCSVGESRTAQRFECDSEKWVCAVCPDGGDVIRLVARRAGLDPKRDFTRAIEMLGGVREIEETPDTARRAGERAYQESGVKSEMPASVPEAYRSLSLSAHWRDGWITAARREAVNARYRERERERLYKNFWERAGKDSVAHAARYLEGRGLLTPPHIRLRWLPEVPYFLDGKERAEPIGAWPAMLAPILNVSPEATPDDLAAGRGYRFSGLHFTWLDPATPNGKALIRHPVSGEILPAKKMRGTKQGGYIDLGGCPPTSAARVVAGEGIENVLAGYTLLAKSYRFAAIEITHFRAAGDLGNLAGKAMDRLAHPTAKTPAGRAVQVPGTVPDRDSLAMPLPPVARAVTWMCDGDSDGFTTRAAMQRAAARHARDGLRQIFMWPGDGCDWNDRITA